MIGKKLQHFATDTSRAVGGVVTTRFCLLITAAAVVGHGLGKGAPNRHD